MGRAFGVRPGRTGTCHREGATPWMVGAVLAVVCGAVGGEKPLLAQGLFQVRAGFYSAFRVLF